MCASGQGTANFGRVNFDRQQLLIQKLGLRVRSLPLVLSVTHREVRLMDRIPTSTTELVRFAASVLPDRHVTVLRSRQAADKWLEERNRQVRLAPLATSSSIIMSARPSPHLSGFDSASMNIISGLRSYSPAGAAVRCVGCDEQSTGRRSR